MNECSSPPAESSRIMSGALAYLALHMESACPRSAYLASLLLNRIASDTDNDTQLRHQAQVLADLIETGHSPYAQRRNTHRDTLRATYPSRLPHGDTA